MPTTYEAPASIGSLTKNKTKLKTSKIMFLVLSNGLKKIIKKIHISTPGIAPIRLQIKCDATQSPLKKIHFANYYYYNNYLFLKGARI